MTIRSIEACFSRINSVYHVFYMDNLVTLNRLLLQNKNGSDFSAM